MAKCEKDEDCANFEVTISYTFQSRYIEQVHYTNKTGMFEFDAPENLLAHFNVGDSNSSNACFQ